MTPYRAGVRAFHAGLPRDACPFVVRPTRTRLWTAGWDAAQAEAAELAALRGQEHVSMS